MKETDKRYDNVRVVNVVDGTTIEGHDAVEAHFKREDEMLREHGPHVIFEVFRINMQAKTLADLQGPRLLEVKADARLFSGSDTC